MSADRDIRSKEGPLFPEQEEYDPLDTRVDLQMPESVKTIAQVEDWVAGDAAKANVALKAEQAKGDDARGSLVTKLEELVSDDGFPGPVGPVVTPGAEGTV